MLAEVGRIEGAYTETLTNHKVDDLPRARRDHGPNRSRARGRARNHRREDPDRDRRAAGHAEIEGIEHAITSNEAFHLDELPKRIVIVGGGYIANEFAGIFHQFGSQVTLVNRTDVILRGYDQQIVDRLIQISLSKGIDFQFNATIDRIERTEDGSCTSR